MGGILKKSQQKVPSGSKWVLRSRAAPRRPRTPAQLPGTAAAGAAHGARPGGARSSRGAPRSSRRAESSERRGAAAAPGEGREGAEFSAVCDGDKVWGAWPPSSSSGWNSCGRSGRRGGGSPGQGPCWLPARPAAPRLGAGLSLITRDLTCPGGQEGLRLREGGEKATASQPEKSPATGRGNGPRPRTFLPGPAPGRSGPAAAGQAAQPRGRRRAPAPGAAPRAAHAAASGPQPSRSRGPGPGVPPPAARSRSGGCGGNNWVQRCLIMKWVVWTGKK